MTKEKKRVKEGKPVTGEVTVGAGHITWFFQLDSLTEDLPMANVTLAYKELNGIFQTNNTIAGSGTLPTADQVRKSNNS